MVVARDRFTFPPVNKCSYGWADRMLLLRELPLWKGFVQF